MNIFLFFLGDDEWNLSLSGHYCHIEGDIACGTSENGEYWNMCVGKKEFKSGKHTWKFKILSMPKSSSGALNYFSIGITKIKKSPKYKKICNSFGVSFTTHFDFMSHFLN